MFYGILDSREKLSRNPAISYNEPKREGEIGGARAQDYKLQRHNIDKSS